MITKESNQIMQNVRFCARCGGHHNRRLKFKRLQRPAIELDGGKIIATHWAMCPKTKEPIWLNILET